MLGQLGLCRRFSCECEGVVWRNADDTTALGVFFSVCFFLFFWSLPSIPCSKNVMVREKEREHARERSSTNRLVHHQYQKLTNPTKKKKHRHGCTTTIYYLITSLSSTTTTTTKKNISAVHTYIHTYITFCSIPYFFHPPQPA